jgi:HD-GYP domain-containing protein (c-di-GMP phosphodiesterase class II)
LEFDAPATGIAGSITDMAANAIHRARLFEQIERRVRELDTLRTIDRAITGSLDLEVTLGVLLDQTLARLAADAAAVHLVDQASNRLECAAARGFRTREIWQTRLKMSGGLIADVVANREAFLGPDIGALGTRFKRRSMATVEGFESMAIFPLVSKGAVRGVLEIFCRTKRNFGSEWTGFAESIAGQAAIAIDNALLFNEMERSNVELSIAYDATIEGWSRAMDLRDRETEGHSERVTKLTLRLATAMEVPEEDLVHVRRGALLHDMGKMGIPDAILHKPGPLSDEEWVVMRMHPVYAFELLRPVRYLEQALDIPYCHHERWDGAGYPRGLSGAGIPVAARIFAVVDVWDALSSNRPYRKAWERGRVIEHVRAGAGSHFDPDVVELFLGMVEQDFREGKSG